MNEISMRLDPLDRCAQEPIRVPGAIQPHGALLLLRAQDGVILQGSVNVSDYLGVEVALDGTQTLRSVLGDAFADDVARWIAGREAIYLARHDAGDLEINASGHRTAQGVILDLERSDGDRRGSDAYYPVLRQFMEQTDGVSQISELCRLAAIQFQALAGFNRVMIYQFNEDWDGAVIAEHGDGALPSYLDLRFPASDIPAQARELYRLNRLRLIPSATYEPVPLSPAMCPVDGKPLDLSFSALRSVSPVHLEYMRNMGTLASMSVSILIDGALWGLVSCHHADERRVGPQVRAACDFLGRIVAQQIAARERALQIDERLRLKRIETELIAHLARSKTFQEGLVERARLWMSLTNSAGAAVITEGSVLAAGATPTLEEIRSLTQFIHAKRVEQVYATDSLAKEWHHGASMAATASGVLAVPISRIHASYIIWFRPEVVRTVTWGGDPGTKALDQTGRLHPRLSFESWKQEVRERALPWNDAETHSAIEFRSAVIDFVLQRAEELAQLTDELQRSNKELESFSYSVSHDLRAPFRHIVGYAQLLADEEPELKDLSRHYLNGITKAGLSAGELVDDLLQFSQLGRTTLDMSRIDMQKVVAEILRSIEIDGTGVEWDVAKLPVAWGDPALIRQALFNLVENAVKYSRDEAQPKIRISGHDRADEVVYSVEDNGVGFDMAFAGKLFQVFQRLHRQEEFEGTGIGLALTKRIIDRHGGMLDANGGVGKGATFRFSLPKPRKADEFGDA